VEKSKQKSWEWQYAVREGDKVHCLFSEVETPDDECPYHRQPVEAKSFTLTTEGMDEHHTVGNLHAMMEAIVDEWVIGRKVVTFVTDNASNAMNAVESMVLESTLTCAAHFVQHAVGHFCHSNLATHT
jgi:hypothetical protein